MELIVIGILLILLIVLVGINDRKRAIRLFICWTTLILCLLSCLRNVAVGNDTFEYYRSFEEISVTSWSILWDNLSAYYSGEAIKDPGYDVLQKLFHCLSSDFVVFLFCVALLFVSAIGRIIYKTVNSLSGCFISYVFYITLFYNYLPNSAIRQTIAMGILLWAIIVIVEKKRIVIPILMVVIASTIHKSVLLGILPLGLYYYKYPNRIFYRALIISPLVFLFGQEVAQYMAMLSATDRYAGYVTSAFYSAEDSKPIVFILQLLILYVLGLRHLPRLASCGSYVRLGYICFALAICLVSFVWVNPNLMRVIAYFSLWGIVYLPFMVNSFHKYRLIVYSFILILLLARPIVTGGHPYVFFWQKMELHERY